MATSTAKSNGKRTRGAQRTTQEDWLDTARAILISEGVDAVKISALAARLNCARSSFYWYFTNREQLLDMLLDQWQHQNTQAIIDQASKPADSINFALSHLFSCWISTAPPDGRLFDTRLDFAVRDWARRDGAVRRAVDISDDARISAIKGMFERFDYPPAESGIRARIVYFTQIGYEALDVRETNLERARNGRDYLYCLTGHPPTEAEVAAVVALTGHSMDDLATDMLT